MINREGRKEREEIIEAAKKPFVPTENLRVLRVFAVNSFYV
jgi:hypothetical protein